MRTTEEILEKLKNARIEYSKDDRNMLAYAWISALDWVLDV